MADDTISDELADLAVNPKKATIGGESVESHAIGDLIEADQYLRERETRQNKRLGISLRRLKHPGSI